MKNINPTKITVIAVIAIIIILVLRKMLKAIKPPNAKYIQGGGPVDANWSPTAITDALYKDFKGVSIFTTSDSMRAFNALTDNQMIAVYNDWNKRYSTESAWFGLFGSLGTLTNMLSDERFQQGTPSYTEASVMIRNLNRLKLA